MVVCKGKQYYQETEKRQVIFVRYLGGLVSVAQQLVYPGFQVTDTETMVNHLAVIDDDIVGDTGESCLLESVTFEELSVEDNWEGQTVALHNTLTGFLVGIKTNTHDFESTT